MHTSNTSSLPRWPHTPAISSSAPFSKTPVHIYSPDLFSSNTPHTLQIPYSVDPSKTYRLHRIGHTQEPPYPLRYNSSTYVLCPTDERTPQYMLPNGNIITSRRPITFPRKTNNLNFPDAHPPHVHITNHYHYSQPLNISIPSPDPLSLMNVSPWNSTPKKFPPPYSKPAPNFPQNCLPFQN